MFDLERRYQVLLALLLGMLLFAGGILYARHYLSPPAPLTVNTVSPSPEEDRTVSVHVAGAVEKPGVYQLPEGSRLLDAVEKAVPDQEADIHALNLASVLNDGQKVYVPRQGEAVDASRSTIGTQGAGEAGPKSFDGKVNLNHATLAELDTLPGIGPALAQRIIDYRQEKGGFRRIEDIKNVSGIGDKLFVQIKDLITVE